MNNIKSSEKQKNNEKWIQKRHYFFRSLGVGLIKPYCRFVYGINIDRFEPLDGKPCLIMMNHQTPGDQFFVSMAFKQPVYFVATEDIFSNGWVSSLMRYAFAPIPIKKATTDISAVRTCMRVAKEGGTIAIAPEGNRTYSGRTGYMNPAITRLAKKLKLPIALFRIEGGYGVQPRWSDGVRKGTMRGYVSEVITPEEYGKLSDAELTSRIEKGLFIDEGKSDGRFLSSKRAEYLERAVYYCPHCGFSEFESSGNEIKCKKCGIRVFYGKDKKLTGINTDFQFRYMTEWYDKQCEYLNSIDTTDMTDKPVFTDTADVYDVIVYKRKKLLRKSSQLRLYGNRITVDETDGIYYKASAPGKGCISLSFDDITAVTAMGRNKLNINLPDKIYQIKGSKRFNALKYVNFYYRYKNIVKGNTDAKFLGL